MQEMTMREKLRQRRKERRLRMLRLFMICAVVVAVFAGIYHYLHRPNFACGSVAIHGTKHLTKVLEKKKADSEADTSTWEAEIDKLVYELYGLTEEEVKVVEGK